MEFDIDGLMAGMADTRKVFHSEADFQHALAWHIHLAMRESQVRLEVDTRPREPQRRFLDIWLPLEGIAIELKYKTRRLQLQHADEFFALRNHGAQDIGRYDFLRDIERLESMCSELEHCKAGFAVLLTNDSSYESEPKNHNTVDSDFRIHEGRTISGRLAWADAASEGTMSGRKEPIQLRGSYRLGWQEFSNFQREQYGSFRYLAVPVK